LYRWSKQHKLEPHQPQSLSVEQVKISSTILQDSTPIPTRNLILSPSLENVTMMVLPPTPSTMPYSGNLKVRLLSLDTQIGRDYTLEHQESKVLQVKSQIFPSVLMMMIFLELPVTMVKLESMRLKVRKDSLRMSWRQMQSLMPMIVRFLDSSGIEVLKIFLSHTVWSKQLKFGISLAVVKQHSLLESLVVQSNMLNGVFKVALWELF